VLALVLRLLVLPYLAAVRAAREEVADEHSLLRREQSLLREAASFPRRVSVVANRFTQSIPELLPGQTPAEAQAAFSREIDRFALHGPALLTRVEPLAPRPVDGGYLALPVRVEGESDLEGFLSLVSALEAGPTLASLSDLSVDAHDRPDGGAAGTGNDAEVVSFRFTVEGYTLAEPADTAGRHGSPEGAR
jgi:hypothetical protein